MDTFLSTNIETIERDLRKLGFSNVAEIFQTAKIEKGEGQGEITGISLYDPSLDPNQISFKFTAASGADGLGYRIHQVIATKEYRPHIHAKSSKMIERAYAVFPGIPTKEQITHEMLLEMHHERNRQYLFENDILRKQLTKLGFDYDNLVASSFEVSASAPELKGITIFHEELPILGHRPGHPKQLSFVLHLRKLPKQLHRLESIFTSVYSGFGETDSNTGQISYSASQGTFPTKVDMIQNLGERIPSQFANISKAQQLFHLISEPSQKNRTNRLAFLQKRQK
jgi:hypothetical protein